MSQIEFLIWDYPHYTICLSKCQGIYCHGWKITLWYLDFFKDCGMDSSYTAVLLYILHYTNLKICSFLNQEKKSHPLFSSLFRKWFWFNRLTYQQTAISYLQVKIIKINLAYASPLLSVWYPDAGGKGHLADYIIQHRVDSRAYMGYGTRTITIDCLYVRENTDVLQYRRNHLYLLYTSRNFKY